MNEERRIRGPVSGWLNKEKEMKSCEAGNGGSRKVQEGKKKQLKADRKKHREESAKLIVAKALHGQRYPMPLS